MSSAAIFRLPNTEEIALAGAELTLAALRATLTQRESTLAKLRSRLHSFEGRYIRQVGVLYVQLDKWYRRIAELDSPLELPPDFSAQPKASVPEEANPATHSKDLTASTVTSPSGPKTSLRTLFRLLAKRIHPDFARDPADEAHRTRLMAQANDALLRSDTALLERMIHAHDHDPAPLTPAAALAEARRQIDRTQTDIFRIEDEAYELLHSDMADLERRTIDAAELGQDLLAELAARVKGSIGIAMSQYERDLHRFRRKQPKPEPKVFFSNKTQSAR